MAVEEEPSVTKCAPGARTPKDQVRVRSRPQTYSTEARGLSGQTLLTRAQLETEAETMAVALNQPHRRGKPYRENDPDYWTSELGAFVRRYYDGGGEKDYAQSTAFLRYRAGRQFAMVIDNDLVARGLRPREHGESEKAGALDERAIEARRDLCAIQRRNAEDSIRLIDRRAVSACTKLCHEGLAIADDLHGLTRNALYLLARHFGIEKAGYHDR